MLCPAPPHETGGARQQCCPWRMEGLYRDVTIDVAPVATRSKAASEPELEPAKVILYRNYAYYVI